MKIAVALLCIILCVLFSAARGSDVDAKCSWPQKPKPVQAKKVNNDCEHCGTKKCPCGKFCPKKPCPCPSEWNMCPILGDVCYCEGTVREAGCCVVNQCHQFECVEGFWECSKRCSNYEEK